MNKIARVALIVAAVGIVGVFVVGYMRRAQSAQGAASASDKPGAASATLGNTGVFFPKVRTPMGLPNLVPF